jgi:TolA-binding protein
MMIGSFMKHRGAMVSYVVVGTLFTAIAPATAQEAAIGKRVDKLEKEMRAVQRTVFPGGAPVFFEGEIAADAATGDRPAASTPLAELTARVDALENQLRAVTETGEQNSFKLRELERQFAAYKAEVDKRLTALEPAVEVDPAVPEGAAPAAVATPASLTPRPAPITQPVAAPAVAKPAAPKPAVAVGGANATRPNAERLAKIKAVEIPATGNAVDDGYTYGYRLWDAKLFPEAQAQLKQVVERNAKHRLASYAQNLLGRAYLDEGKPSLAAVAFYNNYKDRPDGERAPHSLMFMGVALDRLGRKADACKAFRELEDVYGERAPKDVRSDAAAAKAKAGC